MKTDTIESIRNTLEAHNYTPTFSIYANSEIGRVEGIVHNILGDGQSGLLPDSLFLPTIRFRAEKIYNEGWNTPPEYIQEFQTLNEALQFIGVPD